MRAEDIIVVKLGGSLAGSRHLAGWVDTLANFRGRAVIVPGGGPFADAVRQAQTKIGFKEAVAHHLALLAMEQFGQVLVSLSPRFCVADSGAAIRRILRAGSVPVWSPVKMVLRTSEILPSWDITSDSLAAWLAGDIGARQLVLVKHGGPFDGPARADDLVTRGIVDRAFPRFLAASCVPASIVGAKAYASAFGRHSALGIPIDLHEPVARRLHAQSWPRSKSHAGDGR